MKLKLSELPDDVEVSIEETSTVYTVAELKSEIIDLGEPHHESSNWYTIERKRWSPDVSSMIESYIDNEYCDMYEDWDERANDCITDEVVTKIQAVLDEAFKGDYATAYWTYDKPVEIDIFPNGNKKITFKVIDDIYWDDWGHFRRVFCKGDICEGTLHDDGSVTAESPYYEGISDYVDSSCIEIL